MHLRYDLGIVSQETNERIVGSLVLGFLAGAVSGFVTAFIVTWVGISTGRVQLIVFPQSVSPRPIGSWEILTFVISLAVAALTSISVFRYCMKSVRSGRRKPH
jgi:hypothetical protein